MGGKPLSSDEIARAKALRANGMSIKAISIKIGRSRSAIERLVSKPYSDGKRCHDCSAPLSNICKTDYCRSCTRVRFNRVPELTAKRAEGRRRALREDPLKYAWVCQVARANIQKAMQNPETRAKFVELGKAKAAKHFNTPEGRAHRNRPETKARAGASLSEYRLGWCPPEYRDAYRYLTVTKHIHAADARSMIEAQIEVDKGRERRLSPFERQLRALENGARLVANDQKPSLANPGYYGERVA